MKTRVYKKGQKAIMLFHYAGLTSEEGYTIVKVSKDGRVTLDTDEDPDKQFVFDSKTGKCLNDNTWDGAYRTLKLA